MQVRVSRLVRAGVLATAMLCPVAALAADGAVYVYLQPLAADASALTLTIGSVTAVAANGTEYTLKVNGTLTGQSDPPRQRLVAAGRLPPSTYAGLNIALKRAAIKGSRGTVTLTLPEDPLRVDFSFSVASSESAVVWLTLQHDLPVAEDAPFVPRLTAAAPAAPISDYAGFATSTAGGTVTEFDKRLGRVVAVLGGCDGPAGLALDQQRRRLFVACSRDDEIQAIDVTRGTVTDRTRATPGDHPRDLALTPDGLTLLSANPDSNSISFFDARSLTRQDRVGVGSGPGAIVIDSSGRRAFVLNTLSSSISVIDVPGRSVIATLATEPSPLRAAFSGTGDRLYVIHQRSPWMTVLDARQLTVTTRARVPIGVSAIAVDSTRNLVCLGGASDSSIDFYDPNALMPVLSMRTGGGVSYLAVDREGNRLLMVHPQRRTVSAAALGDRRPAWEFDIGGEPYAVVVMGER